MPLFNSRNASAPTALIKDRDRIMEYSLDPKGVKQLRKAGVRSGQAFPASVLASLVRAGLAHSPRIADGRGQEMLGVEEEPSHFLPRCELTGSMSDVHLVVCEEPDGPTARLLGPDPRFLARKTTTMSIPVSVLTLDILGKLEVAHKIPPGSPALAVVQEWLRLDLEGGWEALASANRRSQQSLKFGPQEDELHLD